MSYVDDLAKLAELKDHGILTEEEFNNQKAVLLEAGAHPTQPTPTPAPAPGNPAPAPKKKRGCLWQVVKVAGVVGLLCIFGSCMRSCGNTNSNTAGKSPRVVTSPVQKAPKPNAGLRAVLAEQEAWRAEFRGKIAHYPPERQQALSDGMTYLSAFQQYLESVNNSDNDGVVTSKEAMNRLEGKISHADPVVWNAVERVGAKMNKQSLDNPNIHFDYSAVGDGVLAYVDAIQRKMATQGGNAR